MWGEGRESVGANERLSLLPQGGEESARRGGALHPLAALTTHLVDTYKRSGGARFSWSKASVPRRVLSKPNEGVANGGLDNARGDLIMSVHDELLGGTLGPPRTYVVHDLIGQGTFGQVVRAERQDTRELVAIKVVRNKPAYTKQGLIEIGIVEHLNRVDPEDRHHVVRLLDYFIFQNHVCLVFELLSVNLYELLKSNGYRGLSVNLVRVFVSQLLDGCELLRRHSVVHCDLKPENILLQSVSSPVVKLIDFGSACYENHTAFSYIQSRFYRSPEVLLGLPYGLDIDMWSLGCIVAELYLGLPLFAGTSELEQLHLIQEGELSGGHSWLIAFFFFLPFFSLLTLPLSRASAWSHACVAPAHGQQGVQVLQRQGRRVVAQDGGAVLRGDWSKAA